MSTFQDPVRTVDTTAGLVAATNTSGIPLGTVVAIDAIRIVGTANAAAANIVTLTNASFGQATTITIPDGGAATDTLVTQNSGLTSGTGTKTATATAGAATLNKPSGKITSESVTTAAGSDYVLTLTDSAIAATSNVYVSVANGTNTTEGLAVNRVQPAAGSCVIHVRNTHASAALNGTIVISFTVIN